MKDRSHFAGRSPFFFRDSWIVILALLLTLLAYGLFSYGLKRFRMHSERQQRAALMEKVSMARHSLEPVLVELRAGRTGPEAAIEAARARLRNLCFEDEFGPNYIFMNGMDGRVILRPFRPEDEGSMAFDFRDAKGKGVFQEVIPQLRTSPDGVFLGYAFPNPRTKQMDEKLSFFQMVPELDVMIGTGAYLNDASRAQMALLRYGFFLFLALLLLSLTPLALALGSLRARNHRLIREVQDRVKAEHAMRASEATLQLVLDTVPLGVFWKGLTGAYLGCNAAFARTAGLEKPADIMGRSDFDLPWAEYAEVYQAEDRAVLESTTPLRQIRGAFRDAAGRERTLDTTKVPLENEQGERIGVLGVFEDITERKRAEQAIQESEHRLHTLFEASPIGIFRSTPEGRFQQVNPALALMFRYEDPQSMLEDVNRLGISEALYESPEQRSNLMERLRAHMGTWLVEEVHFRRKDGSFMDGIMSVILHPDPATGLPLLFGFVQDISERKRAEDSLKTQTALLEAQANATLDGILVVDDHQKRIAINRRMIDLCQVPRAILDDEDDSVLLDYVVGLTKEPERFLERVQYLYAHHGETSRDEIEFRSGMVLERYSAPVLGEDGRSYGRIWTFRDITERQQAEREILHLKNYLLNIFNYMPSALVGIDPKGCVTGWNRAAEDLLGVSAAEAEGRALEDLAKDFVPWIVALRQEMEREHRAVSMEKIFLERNGERTFFELMLYPLTTDAEEGAVVSIQDITERARIQDLMIQTEKMMSLGGLAAGMAHEINNPLGIISQATQNIERRLSADLPANRAAAQAIGLDLGLLHTYFEHRKIPQFLGGIREAVTRAARIVSNMLQFSRQADVAKRVTSLTEIVELALDLAANDYDLKKKVDFRSIAIHREFEPGLPSVPVVAIEIEQVLLNLFKNAAQAMSLNPPERPPCLVLRGRCEAKHVVMEIQDNGPGMDESVRRRVFEPFFTTKEPGVGTGLGLSVSYTIITQNHKGLMEVASTPGHGTRFTLRLPVMREREDGAHRLP